MLTTPVLFEDMEYLEICVYCFVGVFLLYILLRPNRGKGAIIPGPKGIPIAGYAFKVSVETLHLNMADHADKYGEIMAIDMFGKKLILLNSERMIRKAFVEDGKTYMNDRPPLFFLQHFFPEGTIVSFHKGFSPEHNALRKAFTKGFHVYGDGSQIFEATVKEEIKNLLAAIENVHGEHFDLTALIRHSVTSLISVFLHGKGLSEDDRLYKAIGNYIDAVIRISTPSMNAVMTMFPFSRHLPGIYRTTYNQLKESVEIITDEYFNKHKLKADGHDELGMVDFLIKEQQKQVVAGTTVTLTDARVIGVILDIVLAGIATSFGSLTSTILCLMRHPDVCTRMQNEILEKVGKDRLPELADKANCPYTEAIFMEVQRYISIVPLATAHYCRSNISLEGFDIPANSAVLPNLWYVHHDEKIWGDPWIFRPERFLGDDGQILPRTHPLMKNWMPFGVGRRQCAGEVFARSRIFLYITTLLQKWTFIPSDDKCGSCDPRSDQFEATVAILPKPFYCRVLENTNVQGVKRVF